jgi:hypothetical protein
LKKSFDIQQQLNYIKDMILTEPTQIEAFRYKTLLRGLRLELNGLKMSRGRSCYSIVKEEFDLKGSKQKVYDQFKQLIEG